MNDQIQCDQYLTTVTDALRSARQEQEVRDADDAARILQSAAIRQQRERLEQEADALHAAMHHAREAVRKCGLTPEQELAVSIYVTQATKYAQARHRLEGMGLK